MAVRVPARGDHARGRQQRRTRGARGAASMGVAPCRRRLRAWATGNSGRAEHADGARVRGEASRAVRGNVFGVQDRRLALAWESVIRNR